MSIEVLFGWYEGKRVKNVFLLKKDVLGLKMEQYRVDKDGGRLQYVGLSIVMVFGGVKKGYVKVDIG